MSTDPVPASPNRRRWTILVVSILAVAVVSISVTVVTVSQGGGDDQPASVSMGGTLPQAGESPVDLLAPDGPETIALATTVTAAGVGYGRIDLSYESLSAQGVECVAAPVETTALTERAPDPAGMVRDFAPVEALVGVDRDVFNCLAQCLPTNPDRWFGVDLAAARPCFDEVTVAAVRVVGLEQTWSVMRSLLAGWPQVSFFCHLSGHKAGQVAFDELKVDLTEAMLSVGEDCITGALHGLLDAFGASNPPVDAFIVPVQACLTLGSGQCADGVGHAAWTGFKEYSAAAEVCGLFEDPLFRYTCDGGVFMRQFEENDLPVDVPDVDDRTAHQAWLTMVVDLCERYRSSNKRVLEEDPGLGCWSTSPYLLWMPLATGARLYAGDLTQMDMETILSDIDAACAAMGPVGAPACRAEHGTNAAPIAGYDLDSSTQLCTLLTSSRPKDEFDLCVRRAADLIEFSQGAR